MIRNVHIHNIHHHHHHDSKLEPIIMAISKEVQEVLDKAKQNETLVGSLTTAFQGLKDQVSTLQATIDDLKVNAPLSEDDKAALVEASTDLTDALNLAQAAIPANTPQEGEVPAT